MDEFDDITYEVGIGIEKGPTGDWGNYAKAPANELARRFADRIIGMRNGRIVFDVATRDLTNDATAALYDDTDPASGARLKVVS